MIFFKIFILPIIFLTRFDIFWILLGKLNILFNNPINSVFITYPSSKKFIKYFTFEIFVDKFNWMIIPISLYKYNNRWGLILGCPTLEKDLDNKDKLKNLISHSLKIKKFLNIKYINYAGIIPSLIKKYNIKNDVIKNNSLKISHIIYLCVKKIFLKHNMDKNNLIIILGSNGYIGKKLSNYLSAKNYNLLKIDVDTSIEYVNKINTKSLLIDVSRKGVLNEYKDIFSNNTILLNEVYPPSKIKQSPFLYAYHLAGIQADLYPEMPQEYKGVIPCCAIPDDEDIENISKKIIITDINRNLNI